MEFSIGTLRFKISFVKLTNSDMITLEVEGEIGDQSVSIYADYAPQATEKINVRAQVSKTQIGEVG